MKIQRLTIKSIDKFIQNLEKTERVDGATKYYKTQAIQYLKLYADYLEDKGKKSVKVDSETGELN